MLIQMIKYSLFLLVLVIVAIWQLNMVESYNQKQVGDVILDIPFKMPSRYNDYSYDTSGGGSSDNYVSY